jgi:hypothetical protein
VVVGRLPPLPPGENVLTMLPPAPARPYQSLLAGARPSGPGFVQPTAEGQLADRDESGLTCYCITCSNAEPHRL